MRFSRTPLFATALLLALQPLSTNAQPKHLEEIYTATTAGMTPAGLSLRLQVIQWSDETGRANTLSAIKAEGAAQALGKLPTVGYVWPAGSPVGYTVKYAHRTPAADGGQRVTLITDKVLGSYDLKKWATTASAPQADKTYSVVELYVDANGVGRGNLSLGADVVFDDAAGTVSLATGGSATNLLANVKREAHP